MVGFYYCILSNIILIAFIVLLMLILWKTRKESSNILAYRARYEQYYLVVIMNLIKRINSLELYQQLESKQITETEFDRELKNCFEMYAVNIGKFVNKEDFDIILDISDKIYAVMMSIKMSPVDISDSDMANLFSLEREVFDGIEKENNV